MSSKTRRADYVLLGLFALLLIFGLLMLTSASSAIGQQRFDDSYFFIKRQLLFGVLPGLAAFLFFAHLSYKKLRRWAPGIFIGIIVLLILVFIPGIGTSHTTGAQSWIGIGGYSFQPAEFAKLGLILFLAAYLGEKGKLVEHITHGFLPALILGMIPVVLIVLQPDIGTVSILFSIVYAMLFLAGANIAHMVGLAVAGLAGLATMIAIAPYRAARFMTFLHPELDPQGIGYHINQAYLAIGSGGLFGLGLGHSRQKFQYLPEVHADSIYAIIAEEMGAIIAIALIAILVAIALRGLHLAKQAPDQFSRLVVAGIITWFVVQSFMNIGAMVGLMPLTGVPLPFVSHGGTALMIAMAAVGILINISKHAKKT